MTAPGLNSYLYSWYTVRELGALGNGNDDDAPSIQRTMDRASSNGGGMVIVPAGTYRLGSSLSWTGLTNVCVWLNVGVSFTGSGSLPSATGTNNSIFDFRAGSPSAGTSVLASLPLASDGLATPTISLPAANAITQTNIVTGSAIVASGLTGTDPNSTRFVGGRYNGCPTSGTFVTGDFVVDLTGSFWICTQGNSSGGVWVQVAANQYPGPPVTGVYAATQLLSTGGTTPVISLDPSAAIVQTNTIGGTSVQATGLPGATAGGRFVGATNNGAPTSGSFLAGDFIIDKTAAIWICTESSSVAAPQGTWQMLAASATPGNIVTGVQASAPLSSTAGTTPTISLPPNGVINQTVPISASALVANGVPGATAGAAFVGGTVNGKPTSGTGYQKGDFVIDQTGSIWICTAIAPTGGPQGTWVQMAGNTVVGSPVTGVSATAPIISTSGTTPTISWDSSYALTQTAVITGTALKPSGLTGATAATRFVGGTASSAPTSGTWSVGDFVVTQNAKIFVCTVAGTAPAAVWTQLTSASSGGSGALTLIATVNVTVQYNGSINFTSIPQTYTDLLITGRLFGNGTAVEEVMLRVNGVTTGYQGYNSKVPSTATAFTQSRNATTGWRAICNWGGSGTTNGWGQFQATIPNYARTATPHVQTISATWDNYGTSALDSYRGWFNGYHVAIPSTYNVTDISILGATGVTDWMVGTYVQLWGRS